jgi:flavorubredoxin
MTLTNRQSGTNVVEIADGIYRINTPVAIEGAGGFSFNQYLIVDDEPLLFHTGPRKMFPLVLEAVASVVPPESLRYIAFSHVEADECGSLNEWLAVAPGSVPLCGAIAAMVSINDLADRPPTTPHSLPFADLDEDAVLRTILQGTATSTGTGFFRPSS